MGLTSISRRLCRRVEDLAFEPPVEVVYNPLDYARAAHEAYLALAGDHQREVLLVGMNPGPWGMVQTGVPFGDVAMVRDWMGIEAPVAPPPAQHPKRPVLGFGCERSEVSGTRLWGWARERFGTPEPFFARFLVWNHCPLAFLEASGRNRTPDRLPAAEREALLAPCADALAEVVDLLAPRIVVGVGVWAERQARAVARDRGVDVGRVLHPSPASPAANRGWAPQMDAGLAALGIET